MAKRQQAAAVDDLKPVVEALIFASDEPLSTKQVRVLIEGEKKSKKKKTAPPSASDLLTEPSVSDAAEGTDASGDSSAPEPLGTSGELETIATDEEKGGLDARTIRNIVDALNADYENAGRSFSIIEIAGGFQFATRKEYGLYVGRLAKDKARRRLSQASLETLAIVAYRQPIAKPDVEAIRGVNCDEVLSSLMERSLITITGRAETVGRPLLYGTTDDFLKYFGLISLKDLPRPREIDEMMDARDANDGQAMLELSADENVAQIEEHLTHRFAPLESGATAEVPQRLADAYATFTTQQHSSEEVNAMSTEPAVHADESKVVIVESLGTGIQFPESTIDLDPNTPEDLRSAPDEDDEEDDETLEDDEINEDELDVFEDEDDDEGEDDGEDDDDEAASHRTNGSA